MQNKVVLHSLGGKILKGITSDFFPNKLAFHLTNTEDGKALEISISDLKAVFFVRDFKGNRYYEEEKTLNRTGLGKKIKILFKDGETMFGYTTGYSKERIGFFIFPVDAMSNNERIFVVNSATEKVLFV